MTSLNPFWNMRVKVPTYKRQDRNGLGHYVIADDQLFFLKVVLNSQLILN